MKMEKLILIIVIIISWSCQTKSNGGSGAESLRSDSIAPQNLSEKVEPVNQEFEQFLAKFPRKELPISINGCEEDDENLYEFDGIKYNQFENERCFAYCQIPTNTNFKAVITLGLADCYIPILTTYKPDGKVIDRKALSIGYCGGDCGFTCEEIMSISEDFKIYVADSIKSYECDSEGNEIPGTLEHYVVFKEGKLLPDGRIELSEEGRKVPIAIGRKIERLED